jgi:mannose-6-phosphate isomerase-like protein (cupin superfamily)
MIELPKCKRPWGGYTILQKGRSWWIKKLMVYKDARTSLQSHLLRAELWFVVHGNIIAEIGKQKYEAATGDVFFVPKKMKHRITGLENACVLEISFGRVLERDIVRHEDDYGRV